MRIAIAQWRQETNTFNPCPTTLDHYTRFGLSSNPAEILERYGEVDELGGFVQALRATADVEILPLLRAVAWSGGTLTRAAADELLNLLLTPLRAALPLDGVLLSLHGATAAEHQPDLTGWVCREVREIIGPGVPLGVCFDLHANVTSELIQTTDILVGYHANPHIDMVETGARTAGLLLRVLRREIQPVTALRKVPVIFGVEQQSTFSGALGEVMDVIRAAEQSGEALNANLYPVQPWLDVPQLGSSVVVTTNGGPATANALADALADLLWDRRDRCSDVRLPPAEIARRVAAATATPVVISDGADSTNSGAPGDSTCLMRAFLAAGTPGPLLISVVDPESAAACHQAGVGAELALPIGGKMDPRTGPPLELTGRVRALTDGQYRVSGHGGSNVPVDAGPSAVFECGTLQLVLTSHLIIGSHPKVYRSVGLEPAEARAVIAKSPYGFRHDYGPFAGEILLADCPGAATGNYPTLTFRHGGQGLYPLTKLTSRKTPDALAQAVSP